MRSPTVMTESTKELIFFSDTSSHHHMPPDRLLNASVGSGGGGGGGVDYIVPVAPKLGNVTAQDILRDLSGCRWTNPSVPDDPPKLVLHLGMGSLFSLVDTSPEYTSASSESAYGA